MSSKTRSGEGHPQSHTPSTFFDNLPNLRAAFPEYPNELTWKNSKGQHISTIESNNPVETATHFASLASSGYEVERPLPNGYVRRLADGSFITLRLSSSSDGSPAVSLNISNEKGTKKIHFIKKKGGSHD